MERETTRPHILPMHTAIADMRAFQRGDTAYNPHGFPRAQKKQWQGRYMQWNVNAGIWRKLLRYFGPLPPLFDSDNAWLNDCLLPPPLALAQTQVQPTSAPSANVNNGSEHSNASLSSASASAFGSLFDMDDQEALESEFALKTHWRMVLVGTRGGGMFNHKDMLRTASWQIQIAGAKRWHLCNGSTQDAHLYHKAGVIDTFAPDYDRYPRMRDAECYLDTVRPGEAIYYPRDYWHQTLNLVTPTITITGTLVDAENHRYVADELKREFAAAAAGSSGSLRIQRFSPQLQRAMEERCFPLWENMSREYYAQAAAAR